VCGGWGPYLPRRQPVIRVVFEQPVDEVRALRRHVRDELLDAAALLWWEVEILCGLSWSTG
jgi:hypothetical protein